MSLCPADPYRSIDSLPLYTDEATDYGYSQQQGSSQQLGRGGKEMGYVEEDEDSQEEQSDSDESDEGERGPRVPLSG